MKICYYLPFDLLFQFSKMEVSMNNMFDTEKGQDVELNLVEIDENSSEDNQHNNIFKFTLIIFIVIGVALIGLMIYKEVSKERTFQSNDGILTFNASRNWTTGKILEENKTASTFSMPVLYLLKNDNRLKPSEFIVMHIVTDISVSNNVDEVYEYWKDNYKYSDLFSANRLKLDKSGKLIPDSANNIKIGEYEARQIEFDEKDLLDIKYAHIFTIVKVDNNYYEVSGVTLRSNRDAFIDEYNKILNSLAVTQKIANE